MSVVGIDLDTKDERSLEFCFERVAGYGQVLWCRESGRGFHLRVKLNRPVSYLESFVVRHRLGDDSERILFDLSRYCSGHHHAIDVLFGAKVIFRRSLCKPCQKR